MHSVRVFFLASFHRYGQCTTSYEPNWTSSPHIHWPIECVCIRKLYNRIVIAAVVYDQFNSVCSIYIVYIYIGRQPASMKHLIVQKRKKKWNERRRTQANKAHRTSELVCTISFNSYGIHTYIFLYTINTIRYFRIALENSIAATISCLCVNVYRRYNTHEQIESWLDLTRLDSTWVACARARLWVRDLCHLLCVFFLCNCCCCHSVLTCAHSTVHTLTERHISFRIWERMIYRMERTAGTSAMSLY